LACVACGAGGADGAPAYDGAKTNSACVLQGPYQLSVPLTEGIFGAWVDLDPADPTGARHPTVGCERGAGGVAIIQSSNAAACTVVACTDGRCRELACSAGDPVTECTAVESYDRTFRCACQQTSVPGDETACPGACVTSMRCEYSWRLYAPGAMP
jgi:hypothetical protein